MLGRPRVGRALAGTRLRREEWRGRGKDEGHEWLIA